MTTEPVSNTGYPRRQWLAIAAVFAIVIIASGGLGAFLLRDRLHITTESDWAIGIYHGSSPFLLSSPSTIVNPVLTAADVTDVPARFVADPFMVCRGGRWYMFFEVLNGASGHGDIGLAVSGDGTEWSYRGIVLDEPFHLSFPYVFAWNDTLYMVPESATAGAIRLYRAAAFPREWELVGELVQGKLADSAVFHYRGAWWILSCGAPWTHDTLRLFHAPFLPGPYSEHPRSPIVAGNGRAARPAGRMIRAGGEWVRFAQDSDPTYGKAVHAFRITTLTHNDYAECRLDGNGVLRGGSARWNRHGMHHIDAHAQRNGTWIACVDGYRKYLTLRIEY